MNTKPILIYRCSTKHFSRATKARECWCSAVQFQIFRTKIDREELHKTAKMLSVGFIPKLINPAFWFTRVRSCLTFFLFWRHPFSMQGQVEMRYAWGKFNSWHFFSFCSYNGVRIRGFGFQRILEEQKWKRQVKGNLLYETWATWIVASDENDGKFEVFR